MDPKIGSPTAPPCKTDTHETVPGIRRRRLPGAGLQALLRRANIYVMPRCNAFQISDDAKPQPHGLVARSGWRD